MRQILRDLGIILIGCTIYIIAVNPQHVNTHDKRMHLGANSSDIKKCIENGGTTASCLAKFLA